MSFIDNFDEVSNTNLEAHTPDTGTGWTLASGSAGSCVVQAGTSELRSRNATNARYLCDDQGSEDNFFIIRASYLGTALADSAVASRFLAPGDFVGWRIAGAGAAGARLSECISNTFTDKVTFQGAVDQWIKVECNGGTAEIFNGGTGGTPSWSSEGSYSIGASLLTDTNQGIRSSEVSTNDWISYFSRNVFDFLETLPSLHA